MNPATQSDGQEGDCSIRENVNGEEERFRRILQEMEIIIIII